MGVFRVFYSLSIVKFATTTEYTELESGANASNLPLTIGLSTLGVTSFIAHTDLLFDHTLPALTSLVSGAGFTAWGVIHKFNNENNV